MHLIPHVHLDLGFTDSQGKVLELHCRNIDRALDLFDSDPSFGFSVDGAVIARSSSGRVLLPRLSGCTPPSGQGSWE